MTLPSRSGVLSVMVAPLSLAWLRLAAKSARCGPASKPRLGPAYSRRWARLMQSSGKWHDATIWAMQSPGVRNKHAKKMPPISCRRNIARHPISRALLDPRLKRTRRHSRRGRDVDCVGCAPEECDCDKAVLFIDSLSIVGARASISPLACQAFLRLQQAIAYFGSSRMASV
jgi:hypothetical protein